MRWEYTLDGMSVTPRRIFESPIHLALCFLEVVKKKKNPENPKGTVVLQEQYPGAVR